MSKVSLGIDTSNYTTSCAAVDDEGHILSDRRIMLEVKDGERGLRQQEALFQHVNNLKTVIGQLMDDIGDADIDCVSCSVSPRPCEGSYMPVFNAGISAASVLSSALHRPLYRFSHQEGHVAAAARGTVLEESDDMVFFHLSGGTTESVSIPGYEITGGTLDISFGQFIDRTGVAMGMRFPCGREMDALACGCTDPGRQFLPEIKVTDAFVNLSGIETFCQRYIQKEDFDREIMCRNIFDACADALCKMTAQINMKTGKRNFLFAGGVSSSIYIRDRLKSMLADDLCVCFGEPDLCRDNAVGTAILGGRERWR